MSADRTSQNEDVLNQRFYGPDIELWKKFYKKIDAVNKDRNLGKLKKKAKLEAIDTEMEETLWKAYLQFKEKGQEDKNARDDLIIWHAWASITSLKNRASYLHERYRVYTQYDVEDMVFDKIEDLCEAIRTFDPEKGVKASKYIAYTVRPRLVDHDQKLYKMAKFYWKYFNLFRDEYRKNPTDAELAEFVNSRLNEDKGEVMTELKIRNRKQVYYIINSIDIDGMSTGEPDDLPIEERLEDKNALPPPDLYEHNLLLERCLKAIPNIRNKNYRKILGVIFIDAVNGVDERTDRELAEVTGIPYENIRTQKFRAMKMLQKELKNNRKMF
jgi:RNA polymerase sigma factor (sigma-70 family)